MAVPSIISIADKKAYIIALIHDDTKIIPQNKYQNKYHCMLIFFDIAGLIT